MMPKIRFLDSNLKPGMNIEVPVDYECFVCATKSKEKGLSMLLGQTAFSRISLGEKLQEILGSKLLVLISPKDRICWDCGSYLNWVDKLEHKIDLIKELIVNNITAKYKKIEVCLTEESENQQILSQADVTENVPPPPPTPKYNFTRDIIDVKEDYAYKQKKRKMFVCKQCGREYASPASLSSHMQNNHADEVCEDCGMHFTSRSKLKRHMKTNHLPPDKELTCVSCGFRTLNTVVYCRHICNSKIVQLTCITCHKRYVDSNFQQDTGSYQCQQCQLLESSTRLDEEERVNHEDPIEEGPYKPEIGTIPTNDHLPPHSAEPDQQQEEPPSLPDTEEIGGSELAVEMPEFFKDPGPKDDELCKKEENDDYLQCEGCGDHFRLQDLSQHPCFVRGEAVKFMEIEAPPQNKKNKRGPSLLYCKTCEYQFPNIEALRTHWDHTGHLREVNTASVEINKIRDKFKQVEATFKVVKQNFSIRGTIPGQLDSQDDKDYKKMFIKISDHQMDPIEDFVKRDGSCCGTCGISFPSSELLTIHQLNDCLTCVTCHVAFYDNKLLKKHYLYTGHASKIRFTEQQISPPIIDVKRALGFKCHLCDKVLQSRFLLQKHFQAHYRGTDKGACQFCLLEFENKNDIQQHVLEVHGAHLYKCSHCERTFMSETFRNKHESKHKPSNECKICNIKLASHKSMLLHMETFHQGTNECRLCGKVVEDPIALRQHERRHYFEKKLQCDLCKKRFRSKFLLLSHSKLHTPDEIKYQCDICPLGFVSEITYNEHRLSHIVLGKYKCNKCGKAFSSKAQYWTHLRTHEPAYACNVCNKSFRDTSLLAIHRRKHWRVRPYQCPQCHRTFSVPATLRRHLHVHTRVFPHRCGICKKGFLTRHAYHRHTETVHAVSNSFPQRRPNIPSLPLNATDEDIFHAADTLIGDDTIMFNEYPTSKDLDHSTTPDLITNEVVVETTELFDEILH